MKIRFLLILAFLVSFLSLKAQDYKVLNMESLPLDMTAREHIKQDERGRQCAVLRISTQNVAPEQRSGFHFECDYASFAVERQIVEGEIWVWVSPGLKTLKIKHSRLGNIELHTANYGLTVEALHTYKITIKGTMVPVISGKPEITQQFLVIKVEPKDALVTVNGMPWSVVDGVAQKRVDFGEYAYRIEAQDYHVEEGSVIVDNSEDKVVVEKTLNPAFGYLKIEGDNAVLSKASIYIDNANGADALTTPRKLMSGQHRVRVMHSKFKPFEQTVTISDGQTNTLNVNLNTNYSTVTLTVEADAEIWINGEMKGVRSWTGDLEAGSYTFECRMKDHKPTLMQTTITENMTGQTIALEAPTPLMGMLVVSTTPIADLFIDGKQMGETPLQTSLTVGQHVLRIKKEGYRPKTETITIEENKTLEVDLQLETLEAPSVQKPKQEEKSKVDKSKVDKPKVEKPEGNIPDITFATLNFAYDFSPQTSFGLSFGSARKWGWFVSAMNNFGFAATKYEYTADADGCVDGEHPCYSDESCSMRLSVMGGAMVRVAEPLYLRAGVGYGMRVKSWYTTDNTLIKISNDSWSGVDLSLGAQLNLKGFVVSLDAVTTSFKTTEVKVGLGYSW